MSQVRCFRRYFGTILIAVGVMAMLLPAFTFFEGRFLQYRLLAQRDSGFAGDLPDEANENDLFQPDAEGADDETNSDMYSDPIDGILPGRFEKVGDEIRLIEQEPQSKAEPFKREDYKTGMLIIEIPSIKVRAAVIDGTTQSHLRKGPGLYEISPLPDLEEGNVCIAGHRTTYGAWFRRLDSLMEGNLIMLDFNGVRYIYEVEKVFVVAKNDWSVTESVGYSALTLTACHPPGSARQRIVARARLTHKNIINI
jgi:LPXTG-site transpeptidase (sortase) family protein